MLQPREVADRSRAREPDRSGFIARDGVRVAYEVFGEGDPAILLLPAWSIVPSRHWKFQVPDLARHFRVVTFDGRGSGASDRPQDPAAYRDSEFAKDAIAVLDACGIETALTVALSQGVRYALQICRMAPGRLQGLISIAPAMTGLGRHHEGRRYPFLGVLDTEKGWAKYNLPYWRRDYRGFLEFFFGEAFPEPHSTKAVEDAVSWGLGTTPEVLAMCDAGNEVGSQGEAAALCGMVRCPVLVLHGDQDRIIPSAWGERLAELTGGGFITLAGCGHLPTLRHPAMVNLLIREFAERFRPPTAVRRTWTRAVSRPRRALFVSSPIGLGHARRDVQIANQLRRLAPGLHIDWFAQPPVTTVLEAAGEAIHPLSRDLASESGHIDAEAHNHELPVFEAFRRMDEILLSNFMLFLDAARAGAYDLWVGDEAWELDHFLHQNPELKTAAYAWLTDFVGWLPLPEGGDREARLTADYNAEMIEQVERFPHVRDRAIFLGDVRDLPDRSFGRGLPRIRAWTADHYRFVPFPTGLDPGSIADRAALRLQLGWRPGQPVCVVAVGGSGTGEQLLRVALAAYAEAERRLPGLRMVCICGPRIDPGRLSAPAGVEVLGYVEGLYRWLAACDVAVVQGGLATTMELTAAGTPFVYVPLRRHFEQQINVHYRLRRYRAGRRLDFEQATPTGLAAAIAAQCGRPAHHRPLTAGGATRAAELIRELL